MSGIEKIIFKLRKNCKILKKIEKKISAPQRKSLLLRLLLLEVISLLLQLLRLLLEVEDESGDRFCVLICLKS
jgi:hypothetical protein